MLCCTEADGVRQQRTVLLFSAGSNGPFCCSALAATDRSAVQRWQQRTVLLFSAGSNGPFCSALATLVHSQTVSFSKNPHGNK
jgi:hypothetical protein